MKAATLIWDDGTYSISDDGIQWQLKRGKNFFAFCTARVSVIRCLREDGYKGLLPEEILSLPDRYPYKVEPVLNKSLIDEEASPQEQQDPRSNPRKTAAQAKRTG